MRASIHLTRAALLASIAVACADSSTPTEPQAITADSASLMRTSAEGGATVDAITTVGWYQYGGKYQAVAAVAVDYVGSNASARIHLRVGAAEAIGENSVAFYIPLWGRVLADTRLSTTETCGLTATAIGRGEAWNEFIGSSALEFGRVWKTTTADASLPACPIKPPPGFDDGGGGDGGDRNCGWYIYQMQDSDGAWFNVGDPFYLCDGDVPPPLWAMNRGANPHAPPLKRNANVKFIATGNLPPFAHAFVQADPAGQADALVIVDTLRASAEDLEAAIAAVNHLVNSDRQLTRARIVVAKHSFTGTLKDLADNRSASLLRRLKASPAIATAAGSTGRSITQRLDLPKVRSKERP